jgi:hypothetical protein
MLHDIHGFDTDNYDLLLRLDFLIKIGVIVGVGKGTIHVRQGHGNNIHVLPLNMVNMLQVVKDKVQINYDATRQTKLGLQSMNINDDF